MSVNRNARNQVFFREVNERIASAGNNLFLQDDELREFICECGRTGCTERVVISMRDYVFVRENPRRFVLVPGHEDPAVERVVETMSKYRIVETSARQRRSLRSIDSLDGPLTQLRCAGCGYGISVRRAPDASPMCRSSEWEHDEWRPFTAMTTDLVPGSQSVSPAPSR